MFVQQPAQPRQQANTVYVAVPKAGDTVTVRVASGTVQVGDTLLAVVRQTGGEGYLLASLVLTVVLVGVTIWAQRQMHRLQTTNNNLQAEHAKLQRDFNQMEAQHEAERRAAERQREEQQRRATDARISGIAFALRRQLISWIGEAPHQMGTLVSSANEVAELEKKHNAPGDRAEFKMPSVSPDVLVPVMQWARERQGHFDRAEQRMLQLVAAAPDGSAAVADSLRRVYVLFYQATSRLNQQVAHFNAYMMADGREVAVAHQEIERCAVELGIAVGPELLKAEALMAEKV